MQKFFNPRPLGPFQNTRILEYCSVLEKLLQTSRYTIQCWQRQCTLVVTSSVGRHAYWIKIWHNTIITITLANKVMWLPLSIAAIGTFVCPLLGLHKVVKQHLWYLVGLWTTAVGKHINKFWRWTSGSYSNWPSGSHFVFLMHDSSDLEVHLDINQILGNLSETINWQARWDSVAQACKTPIIKSMSIHCSVSIMHHWMEHIGYIARMRQLLTNRNNIWPTYPHTLQPQITVLYGHQLHAAML